MSRWSRWVLITVVLVGTPRAFGQGYANPDQSAEAAGRGEAYIADAKTASSIFYNPAGLARLEKAELSLGVHAIWFDTTFEGPSGRDAHDEVYFVPHAFVGVPVDDRLTLGFGAYTSYGLGVNWDAGGPLGGVVDDATLSMITLAPAMAWKLSDSVLVGGALNINVARFERQAFPVIPGVGPGSLDLDGGGVGLGASLGVTWLINDRHTIGAMVRSGFDVTLSGDGTLTSDAFGPLGQGSVSLTLVQPWVVGLGYSVRPIERLSVEFNVIGMFWGGLDRVAISSADPALGSLPPERFDYGDSLSVRVGADYRLTDRVTLRGGYGFFENVTPELTYSPLVPQLDSHLFSVGVGVDLRRFRVDAAYQLIYRPGTSVGASVNSPPGRYEDTTHALMLTLTIPF